MQSSFQGFLQPRPDKKGGGSGIKSIQRGTTTIGAGQLSNTETISAIDPNSCILRITHINGGTTAAYSTFTSTGVITNGTTLTFTRASSSGSAPITWELIEYFNVKSKQTGTKTLAAQTDTITVSNVTSSKYIIEITARSGSTSTELARWLINYALTNSTTITLSQSDLTSKTLEWQLLEFN